MQTDIQTPVRYITSCRLKYIAISIQNEIIKTCYHWIIIFNIKTSSPILTLLSKFPQEKLPVHHLSEGT